MQKRKLIEVALPLEAINRESAREKSIRHGHPSTLHLWWARRPLATARAVLFAQLVDDPSSHPDKFPTEEAQRIERERLHGIIERLVVWENTRDERLLAEARAEILKSTDGNPPPILDPFAGGGTIPLEAQRLGLEAHASDLNPVAVLINKALIEIPSRFRNRPPVYPGLAESQIRSWDGAEGLAADIRAYGQWMRDEAEKRIGQLYPKATLPDGTKAKVIAWIWARTVVCPNPACGIEMPLVRSWWVSKKKGHEAFVNPVVHEDEHARGGKRLSYIVKNQAAGPADGGGGTVGRTGATCVVCESSVDLSYLRVQGKSGKMGSRIIAIVAEGRRKRHFLSPEPSDESIAFVDRPSDFPEGLLSTHPQYMGAPRYGMSRVSDLFTNRQLTALSVFSDLVNEARNRVVDDCVAAGYAKGDRYVEGDNAGSAYADAVATYLGLVVSKSTNLNSSITTWMSDRLAFRETFARQALPMVWDYAEANLLGDVGGGWTTFLDKEAKVIEALPLGNSHVNQLNASSRSMNGLLISTDPPYYDNVPYADLSDYFYLWLRRSIRSVYPDLLSTMLVPKEDELVANHVRHKGKEGAKKFFESGFRQVFARARMAALDDFPITVYYAFKQAESSLEGTSSSGWETLLEGMIQSGWCITATWPVRTEGSGRIRSIGSNALASSIVLALRPRPEDAHTTDRRGFIAALQAELPQALRDLQRGAIAPVDLPQAAIGPGMAVFSRYTQVIEADGSAMTVRSALARINEILDQVLNEQEGDFDATTRFALAWYRQYGYGTGQFGAADGWARARNTSVEAMDRAGVLTSRAGKVKLLGSADLPSDYDALSDRTTSAWEMMHHLIQVLEREGIAPAGELLAAALSRPDGAVDADLIKELAFLLFSVAEKNGWTKDALSFNTLVTSWPEILQASRSSVSPGDEQGVFDFDEDE